jgi:hypothetical protein
LYLPELGSQYSEFTEGKLMKGFGWMVYMKNTLWKIGLPLQLLGEHSGVVSRQKQKHRQKS